MTEPLRYIDKAALERRETIIRQMTAVQGVTEQPKEKKQMLWVGRMNNTGAGAEEIVLFEMIYD